MLQMKHVYIVVGLAAFFITSNLVERAFGQTLPAESGGSGKVPFSRSGLFSNAQADCSFSNLGDVHELTNEKVSDAGGVKSIIFHDTFYPVAQMVNVGKIVMSLDGPIEQVNRHGTVINTLQPLSFSVHNRNDASAHPSPDIDVWSETLWHQNVHDMTQLSVKALPRKFTGTRDWLFGPIIAQMPDNYEVDEYLDLQFQFSITCYSD